MMDRRLRICGQLLSVAIIIMIIFYIVKYPYEEMFGERYVKDQIPLIFPFFVIQSFKPITLLAIFGFALWVILIESDRVSKWMSKPLMQVFLATSAFISMYETVWNFLAWFIAWLLQGGALDTIANMTHEHAGIPVNFNFATKIWFLTAACFLYALWRTNARRHTNL
jgi:hypothetical protein